MISRSTDTKRVKNQTHNVNPPVVETDKTKSEAAMDTGMAFVAGDIEAQASAIRQAPGALGQAMVKRIGHAQGNQFTQRLITSMQDQQKPEEIGGPPTVRPEDEAQDSAVSMEPAAAPTQETPGGKDARILPPPAVVEDHINTVLHSAVATPATEMPQALTQSQTQVQAQHSKERRRLATQWATPPDPAHLLGMTQGTEPPQEEAKTQLSPPEPKHAEAPAIEHDAVTGEQRRSQETSHARAAISAGPRPKVPLAGRSDPVQVPLHRQDTQKAVGTRRAEMDKAATADVGVANLQPTNIAQLRQEAQRPSPPEPAAPERQPETSPALAADPLPVHDIPREMRATLDQAMAPVVAKRMDELAAQHQQERATYEQQTQAVHAEGQRQLTEAAQQTRNEQDRVRQQTQTHVDGIQQTWQAGNARIEAEHDAQAKSLEVKVEQQIQGIVQGHEQQADAKLTRAENQATSQRNQSEAEAARVRQEARREAAAQSQAQQDTSQPPTQENPMAFAEMKIAQIFARMRQKITEILSRGKEEANIKTKEGKNEVGDAIEKLRMELQAILEDILGEYPLLMLWAEMRINETLDNAVDTINQIMKGFQNESTVAEKELQQALDTALEDYEKQCNNLLDRAHFIQQDGLSASETEEMIRQLVDSMQNADEAYVAAQTKRIRRLLGAGERGIGGYGVELIKQNAAGVKSWGYAESLVILTAVDQVSHRLAEAYSGDDIDRRTLFKRIYGPLDFKRWGSNNATDAKAWGDYDHGTINIYKPAFEKAYESGNFSAVQNAIHELGHGFDARSGRSPTKAIEDKWRTDLGFLKRSYNGWKKHGFAGTYLGWQQSQSNSEGEVFADMFLGWVYDEWERGKKGVPHQEYDAVNDTWSLNFEGDMTKAGQARSDWMNANMGNWIDQAIENTQTEQE